MDENLKRRLMGAAIITALAVIFVPMLFEDKSAAPASGIGADIPTLPEGIDEKAMELPQSAEDVARADEAPGVQTEQPTKAAPATGYRIVPLDDTPPKPAPAAKAPAPAPDEGGESAEEDEGTDEDDDATPANAPVANRQARVPKASASPDTSTAVKSTTGKKPKAAASVGAPDEAVGEEPMPAAPAAKSAEAVKKAKTAPPAPAKAAASRQAPPEVPASRDAAKPAPAKPLTPKAAPAAVPKSPAPAVKPPSTYTVQAGSFVSEANAKALAEKLRKQNLSASVRVMKKDTGNVFRVTVGPELSRDRAEQTLKQMESAAGVKGILLPRH